MALELGIFLPVTNNGWILSPSAPPAPPTFALNRSIAEEAERRGFHFLLAQSVWRGHGGVTDFWNTSLEGFTLMSALGAVTDRLGLVASVQPLLYPPPVAAKMVATADDVSGGRFGINVVAGANLTEFEQMSVLPPSWADVRYDYASEWIETVKRLWGDEPSVATTATGSSWPGASRIPSRSSSRTRRSSAPVRRRAGCASRSSTAPTPSSAAPTSRTWPRSTRGTGPGPRSSGARSRPTPPSTT